MELITLVAAQAITKIALEKFVGASAGELGKGMSEAVNLKAKQLGTIVKNKVKGNPSAIRALESAVQGNEEERIRLKNYLCSLWQNEESPFTQEVRKLSDEIHFELSQTQDNSSMNQVINDKATGFQNRAEYGTYNQGTNYNYFYDGPSLH